MDRILRPKYVILPPEAMVGEEQSVSPVAQFTHRLVRDEPYFLNHPQQGLPPDGEFLAGTEVRLIAYDSGAYCRVADRNGTQAWIEYTSLEELKQ